MKLVKYIAKTDSESELIEYPYTVAQLKKENPRVSFPSLITQEVLTSFNCFIVKEARPSVVYDETAYDLVSGVSLIDETWTEKWSLREVDEEEKVVRIESKLLKLDYRGFWKAFTRTSSYMALRAAASTDLTINVLATELISVFADAKAGNLDAEAMETGVDQTLSALRVIDQMLATETEELLSNYKISFTAV